LTAGLTCRERERERERVGDPALFRKDTELSWLGGAERERKREREREKRRGLPLSEDVRTLLHRTVH
jgi:hypothetical protein